MLLESRARNDTNDLPALSQAAVSALGNKKDETAADAKKVCGLAQSWKRDTLLRPLFDRRMPSRTSKLAVIHAVQFEFM